MEIAYQNPDLGLGNFIMVTPAIKKLAEDLGKPVDVYFGTSNIKQCYLDCSFMNHVDSLNNKFPLINSNMSGWNTGYKSTPDFKYSFSMVHKIPWTEKYHTYIDSPQEYDYSNQDYLLILNGLGGDVWKGKKETPEHIHRFIKQHCDLPMWFTGNQTDLDINSPWMKEIADKIELNSIRKALAIVRDAKFIIANDTGLAHAAGALNKNILILWKDTPFLKNQNPGKYTKYALKNEWEEKIIDFLKT